MSRQTNSAGIFSIILDMDTKPNSRPFLILLGLKIKKKSYPFKFKGNKTGLGLVTSKLK